MANIVNPYIAGAPVTEQRMFFGREDIFQWIENSIAGQFADHILVVHGQRRVGKTSVLKQLGNRLPEKYIPVFFDLQGRTHTTLDHFLWWLARETVRVLKQERGIEVRVPEKDDFARDPEYLENTFLPGLQPALGGNSLLYTFDEFDNLEESDVKEELARPLTDYLHRLMGRGEMNFIFSIGSSGRKLENMQAAYTEFFKTALYKKISFLSKEQTHGLVTRPVEGVLEYERAAVERIYRITSGHPYFTQLTCHELFSRCQRTEQRKIANADVEAILDDVVERGTVNLKFVWDEASDIEKWSLAALAHLDKADNRALADFLRKNRVRFSESDLTSGLLHLREKDVLTPQNQFVIHLLKLWLQKNRPLEQVREELTEANPIASRFIEIGLEFRDGGQHDKAIEYFRQALSISADNLQAQVNIALVYAAQGQLEQAVIEFEKALAIDDEDVASRAGLCDAHLALGDAAMKRGRAKDAILSYQRVLAINAEHLEARQRMAELSRQRGEKALTDGRDEEALNAFTEALKYTPEDAALLARVEKVRAEKKAKVLAAQIARSEKEAAARNWDRAIEALNEALETAPGDESILNKIEAIKKKKLQEQLTAILAKVEAAEKTGRWDTAIAGLNEYLRLSPDDAAIQKRLADLIEARHAAWLRAVLARVEGAVTTQNWDEALTALNEALRLEPKNAELQAESARVRETRRIAELEAMLKRADQAAGANRWDEAIQVLNDGLAAEPENETLKTKLAEARKAKREARLQAALRLADSAAQAGKWETAAASLQEVLVNEPDNPEFIQKLAEIKGLERESRLGGLETLAQSLLKAEKFEEALAAWNEYLALLPADREKAQAEIEAIKKAQTLASLYTEATETYAKKNYEKAIDLFKRIVVEDAEYKDATDLLAEAVRLRRAGGKAPRTFNRKAWLTGGLALLLALGIGAAVLWVAKNGLPAMPAPDMPAPDMPAPDLISVGTQAAAASQTPELDPELQAALDTIQSEAPTYETSFDTWDFGEPVENASIENGKLIVTGGLGQSTYVPLDRSSFSSDRFAIKFETQILESGQGGACLLNIGSDDEYGIRSMFWPRGDVEVDHLEVDGYQITIGNGQFDPSNVSTTTLIVLNDQISLFVDGELAFTAHDPERSAVYTNVTYEADSHMTCGFDNFKIWDLSNTIIVTSAEDSGPGTLRQALLAVRAGDVIRFDTKVFPPDSPTPIFLTSELPRISRGHVTIDASDAGVILDGSKFRGNDMFGLIINSDYNTVMGLMFTNIKGIALYIEGGSYNTIGGDRSIGAGPLGQGNLFSNNGMGIDLLSMAGGNVITGNLIGTDKSGIEPKGNEGTGIWIEDNRSYHLVPNTIGPDNVVAFNGGGGIEIDNITTPTIITANSIHDNTGTGIVYNISDAARDTLITPPTLLYFDLDSGSVSGHACQNCNVEIFSTDTQDGKIFEGSITADEFGNFSFSKGEALSGPFLTATSRSPENNTSEFSLPTSARSAIQIALAAIQSEEPLYQTSFDTWDFGEPVDNVRVENGKLIVSSPVAFSEGQHVSVTLDSFRLENFAAEFEFRGLNPSNDGHCILYAENDRNEANYRQIAIGFNKVGDANLLISVQPAIQEDLADSPVDISTTNKITFLIIGEQIFVLKNGQLMFNVLDPRVRTVYTHMMFAASHKIDCEYDNYKIWDLSGVDFNP